MSIRTLMSSTPRARKHHRCSDCAGWIVPGEVYHLQKNIFDGRAYSWKQHFDCRAMSDENVSMGYDPNYFYDGVPPLREDEGVIEGLDWWRGHYPHVVCRIEFHHQISELRWQERITHQEGRNDAP